ncbi:MAG TPA: hypothetical protein OIM50_02305 [Clostridiaceae bacterium]|nr:hypothetical protein [Clostridia bacterium]HJJ09123.1 hypothetical protein [Clostridiaceae bacterium]
MLEVKLVETLVLVFIASELLFQTKVESLYAKTILKKNKEKMETKDSNFLKNIKDTS